MLRESGEACTASLVLFFGASALLGLVRYRRDRHTADLALYVTAGLLLGGTRPEASLLVAGIVAASFVQAPRFRLPALEIGAHGFVVALTFAMWRVVDEGGYSGHYLSRLGGSMPFLPHEALSLQPEFTPFVAIALTAWGAWANLCQPGAARRWTAGLVVLALCVEVPTAIDSLWGPDLANARYHVGALLPASLLFGLGLQALLESDAGRWLLARRVRVTLASAAALASVVPPVIEVTRPRTVDHEYLFLMQTMADLPAGSRFFFPGRDLEIGFRPTAFRSPETTDTALPRWYHWPEDKDSDVGRPRYFVLQSGCSGRFDRPGANETRDRCDQALALYGTRPVAKTTIPALAFGSDKYSSSSIPIGVFCMDEPRTSERPPTAPEASAP